MILGMEAVDWTAVLIYGMPSYIAAIFAGIAALRSAQNGRKLQTSNGSTIGQMVERQGVIAERSPSGAGADK